MVGYLTSLSTWKKGTPVFLTSRCRSSTERSNVRRILSTNPQPTTSLKRYILTENKIQNHLQEIPSPTTILIHKNILQSIAKKGNFMTRTHRVFLFNWSSTFSPVMGKQELLYHSISVLVGCVLFSFSAQKMGWTY